MNTRNKNWGTGALKHISDSLKLELPGIRGFSETNLKKRILNDEDRRNHEEAPIGIILCKDADMDYAGYIMQDFRQPMGVATYRTADEMDPEVLKALPPKEELIRLMQDNGSENLIKKN